MRQKRTGADRKSFMCHVPPGLGTYWKFRRGQAEPTSRSDHVILPMSDLFLELREWEFHMIQPNSWPGVVKAGLLEEVGLALAWPWFGENV